MIPPLALLRERENSLHPVVRRTGWIGPATIGPGRLKFVGRNVVDPPAFSRHRNL